MPGTQAQNVMWAALDEQFPPARTGVPLGLALALVLALALELELALVDGAAALLDELAAPLLQAASGMSATVATSAVIASRFFPGISDLLFDNMPGLLRGRLGAVWVSVGWPPQRG
jgi:hypothetical protein